jgi:hypothetical protein
MAEVAVPRNLFADILCRIDRRLIDELVPGVAAMIEQIGVGLDDPI